ncbi:hypothetical protein GN956_G2008 [Arapaima gigas]
MFSENEARGCGPSARSYTGKAGAPDLDTQRSSLGKAHRSVSPTCPPVRFTQQKSAAELLASRSGKRGRVRTETRIRTRARTAAPPFLNFSSNFSTNFSKSTRTSTLDVVFEAAGPQNGPRNLAVLRDTGRFSRSYTQFSLHMQSNLMRGDIR